MSVVSRPGAHQGHVLDGKAVKVESQLTLRSLAVVLFLT